LDGLGLLWGLILWPQPADEFIAFFFGALGVEGNEAFEDEVVKTLTPSPSPGGRGRVVLC